MSARPSFAFASLLSALALGCGSSSSGGSDGGDSCVSGQTRCQDGVFQECSNSSFVESEVCAGANVCSEALGCVACRPDEGNTCQGDEVRVCNADGSIGDLRQTCAPEQGCFNGSCGNASSCGASGTELIYLVDDAENFLSFDPEKLVPGGEPFTLIGKLSCPAGTPLGGGFGAATPFSMSVDRTGTAWVLYNSGEIFHVSTQDASCQPTSWQPGTGGFELFGMGFVSDAEGSDAETLYIAGGDADALADGNLGSIQRSSLALSTIGPLPAAEYSPELTGTGAAELFGYFPGSASAFVANIDKGDASKGTEWEASTVSGGPSAWAFAHWGGQFYIFVSGGSFGTTNSVHLLDPVTGNASTAIEATPYRVVGAGVSTCAPTQID